MSRLKLAVIGSGRLGRFHAKLASSIDGVELVGVVDPVKGMRDALASELGTRAFGHHEEIIDEIDAAVIATPSIYHHSVGMDLLGRGVHLLIEKPIATNLLEATDLVDAARENSVVLQVGHIERFNPALSAVQPYVEAPRYIEAVRASGYTGRSTDIGVVLDLMIHDLDIALSLIDSPVVEVQATGATVLGPHEDKAEARLTFENGAIANLRASRISHKVERSMQIECACSSAFIDFGGKAEWFCHGQQLLEPTFDINQLTSEEMRHLSESLFDEYLPMTREKVESRNALLDELQDFVTCVQTSSEPKVTGEQCRDAMEVAEIILARIAAGVEQQNRDLRGIQENTIPIRGHRKAG